MNNSQKPKIFLILKIVGFIALISFIIGIILVIKGFDDFRCSCRLVYIGITWHIFFFKSSTKVVNLEKSYKFTTQEIRRFSPALA